MNDVVSSRDKSCPNTGRRRTSVAPPPHRLGLLDLGLLLLLYELVLLLLLLAGAPAVVFSGTEPNVGARPAPGIICAIARCCCNGKMLGQIANSTAPKLNTMPKEARDIIPYYRERQLYKGISLIGLSRNQPFF